MRSSHALEPPDARNGVAGRFIPIAEQTGLISEMGDWAIEQACMDAATWPGDISVAVNVSAFQFKDPSRLIRAVKHALEHSGLVPHGSNSR